MTNEIKKIVSDVLDEHTQRKTGNERWSTGLYLDYRDLELEESTIKMIAKSEDPRGFFNEMVYEAFQESLWNEESELVKAVKEALDEAGIEYDEDELREYIQEHVDVHIPVDEILERNSVCVNIVVDNGDANYEFTKNSFAHHYYGGEGIEDESSLLWLAEQQGCRGEDLKRAFREGTAFDADTFKIMQERDEALKVLESYGKRDAFGYDINVGQYAEAKRIEKELRNCGRDKARHVKTLADLPKTYEDYIQLCNARGISIRFSSAESFAQKRDEIAKNAEIRTKDLSERISALEKEIKDKELEPVFDAEKKYREACGKVVELAQTEEYKKCRMLDSLIECSSSTTSGMNALTFCVQMPLSEYLDLREAIIKEISLNYSSYPDERKGTGEIVLSSKTHTILYDAWCGAGSCSDIELCSDVHLPIRLIYSANPDGMDGYGVKEIYGVSSDFFSATLKDIVPMKEKEIKRSTEKGSGLEDKIASAEVIRNVFDIPENHSASDIDKQH